MTIYHFTDNTDLNVYFHMRNHYKKLKNVKSTIDTSAPQGFMKSSSTPPNSERSWKTCSYEENHGKNYPHLPNHGNAVRRHSCLTSASTKSDSCIRSASLPPRPKTRRHPYEMPCRNQCKSRSQSVGATSRKDVTLRPGYNSVKKKRNSLSSKNKIEEDVAETKGNKTEEEQKKGRKEVSNGETAQSDVTSRSNSSQKTTPSKSGRIVSKSRTEEHEYLQFLLRITEDIIMNNVYSTEDIEKVFQNHIEANRDHLKMEKMQAQLDKLCTELNIPYKITETHTKNEDCYLHFFENNSHNISSYNQHLDSCECTSKRTLEMGTKKHNTLNPYVIEESTRLENNFQLEDSINQCRSDILMSKHSLGRVTECTEPTPSTGTLSNSTIHPSVTTVSSFENVDALPCLQFLDVGGQKEEKILNKDEDCGDTVQQESCNKEPPLTEKEKWGCIEEEILFHKYDTCDDAENSIKNNIVADEPEPKNVESNSENKEIPYNGDETDTDDKKLSALSDILKNKEFYLHSDQFHAELKENSFICLSNIEHSLNEIVTKLGTNVHEFIQKGSMILPGANQGQPVETKFTFDKYTQITVSQCDKECSTGDKLEERSINNDYVLINGPVYVLKTFLDTNEQLILHGNQPYVKKAAEEILPEKLFDDKVALFNCFEPLPVARHVTEADYNTLCFSKLLNSDYDLTPQRDENIPEKYHHLLVDASTSVPNLNVNTAGVANLNPAGLLLTEKYSLNNIGEGEEIVPSDEQSQRVVMSANLFVLNSEPSSDGQYEIKSYTLPKEVNGSVKLTGYSINSQAENDVRSGDQGKELDVLLSAYEIKSEASEFGELEAGRNIMEKVCESVLVDESSSQVSSVRSEKGQSSSSSYTSTKNILGKRKLEHPS